MRSKALILSAVITSVILTGCAGANHKKENLFQEIERDQVSTQAFNDPANAKRAEMMLVQRKLERLQASIAALNAAEVKLQTEITNTQRRRSLVNGSAESQESQRVKVFQEASRNTQLSVAKNSIAHIERQAEIESELSARIATIEANADRLMADIQANMKLAKATLVARAATEKARAEGLMISQNAGMVAPLITGMDVYVDGEDRSKHVNTSVSKSDMANEAAQLANAQSEDVGASAKTVAFSAVSSSPVHSISHTPTIKKVVAKNKTRDVYDVLYVYENRDSWRSFNKMLRAYGVKDLFAAQQKEKGLFFTYVGRYHQLDRAERRKSYLAKVMHTDHATIKKQTIKI